MVNKLIQKKMDHLIRILEAGEKGYAISALNVNNRGLKALFKSYAQQRARFKAEIFFEMKRLGIQFKSRNSIISALHRGRINVFAALTIGQENKELVVLREILFAEKVALRVYEELLEEDLDPETVEILSRHLSEIRRIVDQIQFMRGREGNRMVLRLFDTDRDFETALKELKDSGMRLEAVIWVNFKDVIEMYKGRTSLVAETIFAGALNGAFFGGLVGILSGISMRMAGIVSVRMLMWQGIWPFLTLSGLITGSLIGATLGFAISIGVVDKDAYLYDQSLKRGKIILMTIVNSLRASEAERIMALVNARARTQTD